MISLLLTIGFIGLIAVFALLLIEMRRRSAQIWLPAYMRRPTPAPVAGLQHVLFCFVDHYEPQWAKPDYATEVRRVDEWLERYPLMASEFKDADGCNPKHTFFYPQEEYRREHLDKLAELCKQGFGEIEIHLHHHNDTEAGLRSKLTEFIQQLQDNHGALAVDPDSGKPVFGFIHGNWALDNSATGGIDCGINNELIILREEGCYADFTLPSAPSETQTSKINSIYYATDDPERPKSHDTGTDVRVGGAPEGDLMIIQGPLALDWKRRKFGIIPRVENGEVRGQFDPTPERVDLWVREAPRIQGRPEWLFVKVHTHGTQEDSAETLLGEPIRVMHRYLGERYNDGKKYKLHYVSAREMYNVIRAAEAGLSGNPNDYRDYCLPQPAMLAGQTRN
jgi:hypothetical protein